MSFNTALSGIRAADADLNVTGNNIANAGTTGFKGSRSEFGDVYTSSLLGGGSATPGSGVTTLALRQDFSQGNLQQTQNSMDLAINGAGYFVIKDNGSQLYTRAGSFGLDKQGYVVTPTNARVQGFSADSSGTVGGILGDLKVDVSTQAPRQTTAVNGAFNLDANQSVLESIGSSFVSNGGAIGVAQQSIKNPLTTTSVLPAISAAVLPPTGTGTGIDFSVPANATKFSIQISGSTPASGNGTQVITLDSSTVSTANGSANVTNLTDLANLINSQIYSSTTPINVQASVNATTGNLEFKDTTTGAVSQINISTDSTTVGSSALSTALKAVPITVPAVPPATVDVRSNSVPGAPAVSNGYAPQTLVITGPDGTDATYTSNAGDSAATIASGINALTGVSATATTTATILGASFTNPKNNFELNGVRFSSPDVTTLAKDINALSTTTLSGISAKIVGSDLQITSSRGEDLKFGFNDGTKDIPPASPALTGGTLSVIGAAGSPTQTIPVPAVPPAVTSADPTGTVDGVVVGGTVSVIMDAGYSVKSSVPVVGNLFSPFSATSFTPVPMNAFDPNDQKTYNHATSATIYDSLGNAHTMRSYFVKEPYSPTDPTTQPNHWKMYVQIDGKNVGDPDPTLPPPQNTVPTMASYDVYFKSDGSVDTSKTDNILVSNWTPVDANGKSLGALAPLNVINGGTVPVPQPPTSSNFVINLAGSTQFGSVFAVEKLDQDGYTTGQLTSLDVDSKGILFARFTNGEAQTLGQVALANFNNVQGLKSVGSTEWAQTFETGEAVIGAPGSASLGSIQSGALEESNVDLSQELVNLIIAQRNYQANAKTIETTNATTQTIINLR